MKKIGLFLALAIFLFSMLICTAHAAQSGSCGNNLTYSLDSQGTLTISGTGSMYNWSSYSSVPWYPERGSIKSVVISNGVTSIGAKAFYDCDSLTSITIPDSVTSIGYDAFYGCSSLTSITISDGVTSIGSYAFYGCSSLTNVYITDLKAWCEISFDDFLIGLFDFYFLFTWWLCTVSSFTFC